MKKVIDTLRESGRLEEILLIVTKIATEPSLDYPSAHYIDDEGEWKCRVEMSVVRQELRQWLKLISMTEINESTEFEQLYAYVSGEKDMRLHNYAVMCSRREEVSEEKLEEIRAWETFWSTICYFQTCGEELLPSEFTIPDGWKKKGE